jgi:hypothetical protein
MANKLYIKIMGVWVATKAALDALRCELADCCIKTKKFIIPAGTSGTWRLRKNYWEEFGKWTKPVFISGLDNRSMMNMSWGYDDVENPEYLEVYIGVGTTGFDIHVIL